MRHPKISEISVGVSWLLLCLSSTMMALSSRVWLSLLWAIYGNRDWPLSTQIYLSSIYWFWGIPAIAAIIILIVWRKGLSDRKSHCLQMTFHATSVVIFVTAPLAAIQPFLTTTFGMGL